MELTTIQRREEYWIKRDDLFSVAGVCGGKARACWQLARGATGLITAGSRQSPQINIVAHIAKYLNIPCRGHTPMGVLSPEVLDAQNCGAEIVQHKAGYNSVIISRAQKDAEISGWTLIPFGMECQEAVEITSAQVCNIPIGAKRVIVVVGSGITLAGILHGLRNGGYNLPVLGVQVGADPTKRLDKYAPENWQSMVEIVKSPIDYHTSVSARIGDLLLDPVYEAKVVPYLQPDDLFWIIGVRNSAQKEDTK